MENERAKVKHDHTTLLIEAVALAVILGAVLVIVAVRWPKDNPESEGIVFHVDVQGHKLLFMTWDDGHWITNDVILPVTYPKDWVRYGMQMEGNKVIFFLNGEPVATNAMKPKL